MKKCYLDANALVYFCNRQSAKHQQTVALLTRLMREEYNLYISPLCIDEFLHSLKQLFFQNKSMEEIWEQLNYALEGVLAIPRLLIIHTSSEKDKQKEVEQLMRQYNMSPRDAYHLFTMHSHYLDCLATFDKDFSKVTTITIIS